MADLKISALTAATTPLGGTEVFPIVQSSTTVKASIANVQAAPVAAGTANAVQYLNGSKVPTTGTALAFDGTYALGVGATLSAWGGNYRAVQAGSTAVFAGNTAANRNYASSNVYWDGSNYKYITTSFATQLEQSDGAFYWLQAASGTAGNNISFAVGMSLDNSANLTVAGATQTDGLVSHAGTGGAFGSNKFNLQWTGNPILWVDGTNVGQIATVSDYRIKRNIASQTESGLAKVMQLRPVVYQLANYNNLFVASDEIKEGFIAHELQEIIPSAVSGQKDAEDQIQSLKLDAVCAVLAKAIQEQQAQIEALKADVAALKGA